MKVVILAGGFGTRLSEETEIKPKPMVEIGGMPILWHIMKIYSHYGFNDFVICLGYKGYYVKEYFSNYFLHQSDITFDFSNDNKTEIHYHTAEPWKVTLINTGLNTMTGGRIKRIKDYIGNERFLMTYGDGVSDVNISNLLKHHEESGRMATVTSVQPTGRFGALDFYDDGTVKKFLEKPKGDGSWINGGFFVLEPKVFDYIDGDETVFEKSALEKICQENQLAAYKHDGFWRPMDTIRDKRDLDDMWANGNASWKIWVD